MRYLPRLSRWLFPRRHYILLLIIKCVGLDNLRGLYQPLTLRGITAEKSTDNSSQEQGQIECTQFSRLSEQTPSAVQKIKELLKDKPDHVGVKVGVRTRGCNGLSYTLEYTKSKGDSDEEVVQDGVRVFIEKKAQLTLLGTEMDYVEDKLSSEFVFNNPNIKGTCGCGESFNI
ncbi:iron-sulfur cluster assembly 1 homolog, mitochondrial [Cyanistes caeruleus]|nr:iron-sulfur cluster assembly 1 homolog, mitochondrial [Cyanistes caeruleus]